MGDGTKQPPASAAVSSPSQTQRVLPLKLQRPKNGSCPVRGESEAGLGVRGTEASSGLRDTAETVCGAAGQGPSPPLPSSLSEEVAAPHCPCLKDREAEEPPATVGVKPKKGETRGSPSRDPGFKAAGTDCAAATEASEACSLQAPASDQKGKTTEGSEHCQEQPRARQRGEETQPRVAEATVCAKNIKVSSTGEKVVLWTR